MLFPVLGAHSSELPGEHVQHRSQEVKFWCVLNMNEPVPREGEMSLLVDKCLLYTREVLQSPRTHVKRQRQQCTAVIPVLQRQEEPRAF